MLTWPEKLQHVEMLGIQASFLPDGQVTSLQAHTSQQIERRSHTYLSVTHCAGLHSTRVTQKESFVREFACRNEMNTP